MCWWKSVATVEKHEVSLLVIIPFSIQTCLRKLLRASDDATSYINDSDFALTVNQLIPAWKRDFYVTEITQTMPGACAPC